MDYLRVFGFDEFNDGGRVHINLSQHAWLIIKQDQDSFASDDKKVSDSGFLNKVFTNFYQHANASLYTRTEQRRNELDEMFPDNDTSITASNDLNDLALNEVRIQERVIMKRQMLEQYVNALKDEIATYPKGTGFKLKLNKENISIVNELLEGEYYDNNLGKYLKAVFEEYTRLPTYVREQYFFKDVYDDFMAALDNGKQLKISTAKRMKADGSNDIVERKFYLSPYKIMQDPAMNFNYLVGYSQEIDKQGNKLDKKMVSYRLSRIIKSDIMLSLSGFISKADKQSLEEEIINKGVAFLIGDIIDITIKFTNKGLEHFKKQLYMRPNHYEVIDEKENLYEFHCTKAQAINYFYKLGRDIKIIKPLDLKETFINRYQSALDVYKD